MDITTVVLIVIIIILITKLFKINIYKESYRIGPPGYDNWLYKTFYETPTYDPDYLYYLKFPEQKPPPKKSKRTTTEQPTVIVVNK